MIQFPTDSLHPASPGETDHRALDFYDAELRPLLEPQRNGQYVAIHPATCDYVVDRRPGKAFRALRAQQPQGPIVLRHIGTADADLRARLRGELPH